MDGLEYIASNADLITAFGPDAIAGLKHFASTGQYEHRAADTFDVDQYLEKYEDLRNAFGDDTQSAIIHYISNGFTEGRTDELL